MLVCRKGGSVIHPKRLALALLAIISFSVLVARPARAADESLAGPMKFDLKFGPAVGILDESGSQFRLGFHYGYGFTPHLPQHVYLDLPLDFDFGNHFTEIIIIPGIEVDFLLPVGVPVYLYPMFGI